jgi:hypothetical protein
MKGLSSLLAVPIIVLIAGVAPGPLSPDRTAASTDERPVTVQTFPNGDRAGVVSKQPKQALPGPLYSRPPTPRDPRVDDDHRPGPTRFPDTGRGDPPGPSPQSNDAPPAAQVDSTFLLKRNTALTAVSGHTSNVNEPSISGQGNTIFQTGNWYAAVSTDNGATFSFIDPDTTFPGTPSAFSAGFCCDQRVAQAPERDLVFWSLLYSKTGTGPQDTNGMRLAFASGASDVARNTWEYFDLTPADFGFGPGKWLDFPNIQTNTNWVYFTANVFDTTSGPSADATHSVIGRIPLVLLGTGLSVPMGTFVTTQFFSPAPVSGATSTMYLGSVSGSTSLRVIRWDDGNASPTASVVSGLQTTNVNTRFSCPGPDGLDPCTRADERMQTGWLTSSELGFMWNSAQGASRPYPFVRTAILDPSTLAVISQPDITNDDYAWLFPAVAVNARGHLGGHVYSLGGDRLPTMDALIRDNFSADPSDSGWELHQVATSTHGTNGRWGDYSGAVAHERFPRTWLAVGHVQAGGSANSNALPRNIWFMRQRDDPDVAASPTPTLPLTPVGRTPSATPTRTLAPTATVTPTPRPTLTSTVLPTPSANCSQVSASPTDSAPRSAEERASVALADPDVRHYQVLAAVQYDDSAPGARASLSPGPGVLTVVCEPFEAIWPSAGWQTFDMGPISRYCWASVPFQARFGSRSAWPAAGCPGGVDPSRSPYPDNANSWMVYGPFSLADARAADVRFSAWYRMERGADFLFWGASVDGAVFSGFRTSGESTPATPPTASGWRDVTLNLTEVPGLGNLTGRPAVWVAWAFTSDGSETDRGPFVDDVLIQKQLIDPTVTPTGGPATSTPTPSSTPTPTPTPTPSSTPAPTAPPTGGRGFAISRASGFSVLSWSPGDGQLGYWIYRSEGNALLPRSGPLGRNVTSFVDFEPTTGRPCYVLLPLADNPPRVLGLSDLLCAVPQTGSATGSPQSFTLRLNQSRVAELSWTGPSGGGQDGYLLVSTDGPPALIDATATRTTRPIAGFTCYALLALRGGVPMGNTDFLCGVPGVATLADSSFLIVPNRLEATSVPLDGGGSGRG